MDLFMEKNYCIVKILFVCFFLNPKSLVNLFDVLLII